MIPLTAAEIAEITGGRLHGFEAAGLDPQALTLTAAETDSRQMTPGSLFIAKPGETTDGHHFIDAALAAGAQLVLAERATNAPDGTEHPSVIVPDVVAAMGALAAEIVRRIRAHSPTTVIGITGSAGKTTTKDLLAALLREAGPTTAPQGSYNGEVGVPLTVFTAELDTRYLIIEMGADGPGHIRYLCEMVKPDIGVVLMVGSAHAGKFGGADKIAQTKGELAELATEHVILNDDDAQVRAMADRASAPITWTTSDSMDVSSRTVAAKSLTLDSDGRPQFTLSFGPSREEFAVTSGLTGAHHITNILAAAAAAYRAGVEPEDIAARLQGLGPASRWRMERSVIDFKGEPQSLTIINDAYNANPESMREALRTLAMLTRPSAQDPLAAPRRSVAVLGAMLELGDESIIKHAQLGETVVRLNIDKTLVVGETAYPLYRGAIAEGSWGSEVHWVATAEEAESWLKSTLEPGDIVLLKSSNGAGLRLLGDKIASWEGTE